jgi:hypothetical protein
MTRIPVALIGSLALMACNKGKQDTTTVEAEVPQPSVTEEAPQAEATPPPVEQEERPPAVDSELTEPVTRNLADVEWQDGPAALPKGAKMAVIEGTPPFSEPRTFTLLLKFPRSYTIPPHVHAVTERVTVLSGALSFAHGEIPDR